MRPPDLARIERQHGGAPLEAGRKYVVADDAHRGVDIDQTVELGPTVRRSERSIPNRIAGRERYSHHLAVVEPADRDLLGDHGNRRTPQAQARHLLLDRPELLAA